MKTFVKSLNVILVLIISSCNFTVSTNTGNKTADNLATVSKSKTPIRNAIELEEQRDLKVETAFLMLENGNFVPEDNIIKAGERFKLILKLSGWKASNGKVQIGAGERLRNSNQVVMLQEDDLFANAGAISEADAQIITLSMEVLNTEIIYDFYQSDFKVWNKNADQIIRGNYRFKLIK